MEILLTLAVLTLMWIVWNLCTLNSKMNDVFQRLREHDNSVNDRISDLVRLQVRREMKEDEVIEVKWEHVPVLKKLAKKRGRPKGSRNKKK